MVGQGSKVGRDSVPLVSFAKPIISSMVSVDELDDSVGTQGYRLRNGKVVLRNRSGSSCSFILAADSDVRVEGHERPLSDSQAERHLIADSFWADQVEEEELDDTTITRRSTRIARGLASYKSGSRAFSRVFDD
ncbi:hypothetical protein LWI29_021109 [Acer saccharum]|uniref:Uncharacterized protein n=1 Tax=Acer saccharum TaxID=4024 RepID=A0AA39VJ63_ACESA|nr:hypothetical protein LWI29_021109 [Acer saccharum]